MIQYVIYGTTDFSRELRYYVESDGGRVFAYVLDSQFIKDDKFDDLPVISYNQLNKYYEKNEIEILVSLGYSDMNDNRGNIINKCRKDGWMIGSFIHSSVKNLASYIGQGNIIMDCADIRLNTKIGDGNIILSHSIISHDCRIGSYNYLATNSHFCGGVTIGDNNFIGAGSIIQNRHSIKNYNLIGAGVCLNKDLENETMVTPAETRIEHVDRKRMDKYLMRRTFMAS